MLRDCGFGEKQLLDCRATERRARTRRASLHTTTTPLPEIAIDTCSATREVTRNGSENARHSIPQPATHSPRRFSLRGVNSAAIPPSGVQRRSSRLPNGFRTR